MGFTAFLPLFAAIVGGIAVHRGLSDSTSSKLRPLESATNIAHFQRIWTSGGILLFATTFLGFWGADAESRIALITYKILLCCIICAQIVIVCYFSLGTNSVTEQIHNQLAAWTNDYKKQNSTQQKLDDIQAYLDCCELNPKIANVSLSNYPVSCCPPEIRLTKNTCDERSAYNSTCTEIASNYFHVKMAIYVSFVLRTVVPEMACVVFASMVVEKITLLENLMQGKLS